MTLTKAQPTFYAYVAGLCGVTGAIVLGLIAISPAQALDAESTAGRCADLAKIKKSVADEKGQWVPLTLDQFQFIRGVFVNDAHTPSGLPIGDKAALAINADKQSALSFFLDGKRACDPMPFTKAGVQMLRDIAAGVVKHEGSL